MTLCSGNPVSAAIPNQAAEAVLAIPPLSEMYFFWSGHGRPETPVRGWRRSLEHVYTAADLKRNGKKLRAQIYMRRHTSPREAQCRCLIGRCFAPAGAHNIKITERRYLRFDQHRQERLTRLPWWTTAAPFGLVCLNCEVKLSYTSPSESILFGPKLHKWLHSRHQLRDDCACPRQIRHRQ
jgi:hypothetical protein